MACLLVYLSLLRLTGRVWAALAGAWGLAFSRFFWHYAEVAEVFPLNNLFVALLTYILFLIKENVGKTRQHVNIKKQSPLDSCAIKYFWVFSFSFGLALTNHQTIVLLAPAALFFLWSTEPSLFRRGKILGLAALFFFVGLSPYLYCSLAAMAKPLINWDNPVTLKNFVRLISRADYGTFSLLSSESEHRVSFSRFSQLPAFLTGLYHQFTALGIGLALFGMLHCKRHKHFQGYLALAFFFSGIFFLMFANMPIQNPLLLGVLHRFYIMPAVLFSLWIGLGVDFVLEWLEQKKNLRRVRLALPVVLIPGLIIWQFAANVEEADFRDNYMAEDFAHNLILSLPENSVFFVRGDVASMGVDYFQMVLGQRPDVVCLDQAKLTYDWYYEQAKERFPNVTLPGERYDGMHTLNGHLIARNIGQFAICFMDFKEDSYQQAFQAVPFGLVYKMLPKSQKYSPEELEAHFNQFYAKMKKRGWERDYPETSFECEIKQIYAEPFFRLGFEFEQAGGLTKAGQYYNKALAMNPANYRVLKNLAVLYFYKLPRQGEAIEIFKRYLELNPGDVDAGKIKQIIASHEEAARH
jgi:tetratricopeptide (TPR) repeat protein